MTKATLKDVFDHLDRKGFVQRLGVGDTLYVDPRGILFLKKGEDVNIVGQYSPESADPFYRINGPLIEERMEEAGKVVRDYFSSREN